MRTFITIELPPEQQLYVEQAQASLRRRLSPAAASMVRWTPTANVHLTLRFLGETDEDARRALHTRLAEIVRTSSALTLELANLGAFPDLRAPSVLWLGVHGEQPALAELQAAIERAARASGFPHESRAFRPHLTIGRIQRSASSPARHQFGSEFAGLVASREQPTSTFCVAEVVHMRSDLGAAGARYTPLTRYSLQGAV